MNILILDAVIPTTVHSGKMVIIRHVARELSKLHNVHYFYIKQPGEQFILPEYLMDYFASVKTVQLQLKESFLGRTMNTFQEKADADL